MQVLKKDDAKYKAPEGELVFWRCCIAQPFLLLLASLASVLMIVMALIAGCSFALDAWRRSEPD